MNKIEESAMLFQFWGINILKKHGVNNILHMIYGDTNHYIWRTEWNGCFQNIEPDT
jgi:hypothetical protein